MNYGVVIQPRSKATKAIRVLIADPDEALLCEYQEHLREDFEVDTTLSGLECIARMREQVPDVLVLEPALPWGGGDGVLAMMHDVLDLACVPVMVLTSCRDAMILDNILRYPVSDFHCKPLLPAQLLSRVYALLQHHTLSSNFAVQNRRLESVIAMGNGGGASQVASDE